MNILIKSSEKSIEYCLKLKTTILQFYFIENQIIRHYNGQTSRFLSTNINYLQDSAKLMFIFIS